MIDDCCSRCHEPIPDYQPPGSGMTAGYYVAAAWSEFMHPGETQICDRCMWTDPRFIAIYGEHPLP